MAATHNKRPGDSAKFDENKITSEWTTSFNSKIVMTPPTKWQGLAENVSYFMTEP